MEKLEAAGQTSACKYLKGRLHDQVSIRNVLGLLRAKWNSSFLGLEPLYTSYVPHATQADWRVQYIAQGARKQHM